MTSEDIKHQLIIIINQSIYISEVIENYQNPLKESFEGLQVNNFIIIFSITELD